MILESGQIPLVLVKSLNFLLMWLLYGQSEQKGNTKRKKITKLIKNFLFNNFKLMKLKMLFSKSISFIILKSISAYHTACCLQNQFKIWGIEKVRLATSLVIRATSNLAVCLQMPERSKSSIAHIANIPGASGDQLTTTFPIISINKSNNCLNITFQHLLQCLVWRLK